MTSGSPLHSCFAGMMSGVSSALLFQPFDVVKTKVQIASTQSSSSPYHRSLRYVFLETIDHGRHISALWRGLTPSIARIVPGAGLYFMSLSCLSSASEYYWPQSSHSHTTKFMEGGVARLFTDLILLPFTVLKTRYESGHFIYGSLSSALRTTYETEGLRGLYSGLAPTLLRDVPFSGLYLAFYTFMKNSVGLAGTSGNSEVKSVPASSLSTFRLFLCAGTSGIVASLITQPFDVVKTHIQLRPNEFSSLMACVRWVHSTQGLRGFLSGSIPRCTRRTLMTAVAWTLYERIMSYVGIKNATH